MAPREKLNSTPTIMMTRLGKMMILRPR